MKPVVNYENYQVDENGNVFNIKTHSWLKGSVGENGYKYYRLSKDGRKKMVYAHRLVAEAYLVNPNNDEVVNHINHNKLDNNVNNLEWVSYSKNTKLWHEFNKEKLNRPSKYYDKDMPNEIWKPYKNYDVSSLGRIKHHKKGNLLRPALICGYYKVRLSNDGLAEDWLIHKLVFLLFSSEPIDDTKVIDHIDGNKLNNTITNLRQISLTENVLAALYEQKTNSSVKRVGQFDLNNNLIQEFCSIREAARILNLDSSTISKVCQGKNKTHGGFIFKYI